MARPYIRAVNVDHYRALNSLELSGLRRVNLIGGLNGAGKSTLLEVLFTFLDLFGPYPILRPLLFRQLPPSYSMAKALIFEGGRGDCFNVRVTTRDEKIDVSYKWEQQKILQQSAPIADPRQVSAESFGQPEGVTITATRNGSVILRRHTADIPGGYAVHDEVQMAASLPNAGLQSRYTTGLPIDIARRYTMAVQNGKKTQILDFVQQISNAVSDLQLLQVGDQSLLHAELRDGSLVPISFIGDGALTLVSVALTIIECRDGVVLLDEFDASIHYSRLENLWTIVRTLAEENNCQIFAATHSRESILAAARAFSSGHEKDFNYVRLSIINRRTIATSYSHEEILSAEAGEWEIR